MFPCWEARKSVGLKEMERLQPCLKFASGDRGFCRQFSCKTKAAESGGLLML